MRKLFLTLSFLFAVTAVNGQNLIKDYPGIPLVTYLYDLDDSGPYFSPVYNKIDTLGIYSAIITDLNSTQYSGYDLGDFDFTIIPDQRNENSLGGTGRDLINRYTEAKYSLWQAEGTPEEDGLATLYMNNIYTVKAESDTVIRTKPEFIPKGTELINGPSCWQEGSYFMVKPTLPTPNVIEYRADFYLKIEDLIPQESQPSDTLCILQVTTSYIDVNPATGLWDTLAYHIIQSDTLFYGNFTSTNQWQHFLLEYDLTGLPDSFYNNLGGKMINPPPANGWDPGERNTIQNVEYKIVWKGNSEIVRLYMDNITLSDLRGRDLHQTTTQDQILAMLQASYITNNSDWETKISGWIGLDEPGSIDNFEPIRIVNELLEDNPNSDAKLWISLGGSWNGRYGNPENPSPGQRLHKVDEFFRRVKRANVLQNFYPYDYPCLENSTDSYCQGDDYKIINIKTMADSFYAHFNQWSGAYWGVSVQVGQVPELSYRDMQSHELFYQTNLALLYGAKIISPWIIFADPGGINGRTALINYISTNNFEYTDKYYSFKDSLAPRLKGLMGKTLKNLKPLEQKLNFTPSGTAVLNYRYIKKVILNGSSQENIPCWLDLGFFSDPFTDDIDGSEKRFFMLVNRYYSATTYDDFKFYLKI